MRTLRPPIIERQAELPSGLAFIYGGRPLKVVKTYGTDPAAPVILEEMSDRHAMKGQLSLWGNDGVRRALATKR